MIKIAASILSADFSNLTKDIKKVEQAGADLLHIDVMDGNFVPNITIGPVVIKAIRRVTKLPLDVHLMIEHPLKLLDSFIDAGSDMITIHIEVISKSKFPVALRRGLAYGGKNQKSKLETKGIKLGISLNPATPLSEIKPVLEYADFVLVMSVNPGFAGQEFISSVLPKIKELRAVFSRDISIDGGINEKTAKLALEAGANILAAGSYIFGSKNWTDSIRRLRCAK